LRKNDKNEMVRKDSWRWMKKADIKKKVGDENIDAEQASCLLL